MIIPSREGIENKLKNQYLKFRNFDNTPLALYELLKGVIDELLQSISVEIFELYRKISDLERRLSEIQEKDKLK